jgi:TPP-dependent pyruvate/acetoin dehydrogenase alpha subunit
MAEADAGQDRYSLTLELFRATARIRAFELAMNAHVAEEGFEGFWHSAIGQEGTQAGTVLAMEPGDYLFYTHRGGGYAIARGLPVVQLFGDLFGRVVGTTHGKGGGTPHYIDVARGIMGESGVLGSSFALGAGAALTSKMSGSGRVAVVFFGDGTAARGTFHEALLQSSVWGLPLVLVCENNGFALSAPFATQSPTENVADRAAGYGVPGVIVDGQRPLEVHDAVSVALDRARAGEGPTLVECKTVRVHGHFTGDPQRYRSDLDGRGVQFVDPLEVLRAGIDPTVADVIEAEAHGEITAARAEALASPRPNPSVIYEDLFAP